MTSTTSATNPASVGDYHNNGGYIPMSNYNPTQQQPISTIPLDDDLVKGTNAAGKHNDFPTTVKHMKEDMNRMIVLGQQNIRRIFPVLTFEQCRIVNLVAYCLNIIITYGISVMGGIIFSVPTYAQVSQKYQTLVTPAQYTFGIWGVIYLLQLIWILQQYMNYNATAYYNVVHIQYQYVIVVVFQCFWTIAFSYEYLILSVLLMIGLLVTLWSIVIFNRNGNDNDEGGGDDDKEHDENSSQHPSRRTYYFYPAANEVRRAKNGSSVRYWIEEFPFTIHIGWIIMALFVNLNVVIVAARDIELDFEYTFAMATLYVIALLMIYVFFSLEYISVPIAISWGLFGIYDELMHSPSNMIISQYTTSEIHHIARIALVFSVFSMITVVLRIVYTLQQKCVSLPEEMSTVTDTYYENPDEHIISSNTKPITSIAVVDGNDDSHPVPSGGNDGASAMA